MAMLVNSVIFGLLFIGINSACFIDTNFNWLGVLMEGIIFADMHLTWLEGISKEGLKTLKAGCTFKFSHLNSNRKS